MTVKAFVKTSGISKMVPQSTIPSKRKRLLNINGMLHRPSQPHHRTSQKLRMTIPQQKSQIERAYIEEVYMHGFYLIE